MTLLNYCTAYLQLLQTHSALEELINTEMLSSQDQENVCSEGLEEQVKFYIVFVKTLLKIYWTSYSLLLISSLLNSLAFFSYF